MRVLVAPTSFKGSLTPRQAADAIADGFRMGCPGVDLVHRPLADGGEGTLQVLLDALDGDARPTVVDDPLGRPAEAEIGLIDGGRIAIVESAQAIGLGRLNRDELDPLRASSAGVGQLTLAALETGAETLWIGLGGSATVDGGLGMLQALGGRCLDRLGHPLPRGGQSLSQVGSIDLSTVDARLETVKLVALCDVVSPLLGERGAQLYMAQKGVNPEQVVHLDAGLRRWAEVMARDVGVTVAERPGSGAAGGLGAALAALGAELRSGSRLILDALHVDDAVPSADLIVTGEGQLDVQTAEGKPIAELRRLAQTHERPIVALCGSRSNAGSLSDLGPMAVFAIVPGPMTADEAMAEAGDHLRETAQQVGALVDALGEGAVDGPDR